MEHHIPRKDMDKKKRFTLSTEVRATLERKHDRWTHVRAFDRVNKELLFLYSLAKMLSALFKKDNDSGDKEEVLCDGRAVKMFSDMIRNLLRMMTSFQVNIIIYAGHCKILVFFSFAVLKGIEIMITIILFCRMRVESRPYFYRRSRENCVRGSEGTIKRGRCFIR